MSLFDVFKLAGDYAKAKKYLEGKKADAEKIKVLIERLKTLIEYVKDMIEELKEYTNKVHSTIEGLRGLVKEDK